MTESTWLERKVNWLAVMGSNPPAGRSVLGTDSTGQVHEAIRSGKGKWEWSHDGSAAEITHWMELPMPPARFELERVAAMLPKSLSSDLSPGVA